MINVQGMEGLREAGQIKNVLTQYRIIGNSYAPTTETVKCLPTGIYCIKASPEIGIFFEPMYVTTDALLLFPDTKSNTIAKEIERFWNLKERFDKLGFIHKRGILLHGIPGGGKSSTIMLVANSVLAKDGIVIVSENPYQLIEILPQFRAVEPNRPLLVIMEDIDSVIADYGERTLLSILDGEHQIDNVIYIATTNYLDKLRERIVNRPSRFDLVIQIDAPSTEARAMYFKNKLGNIVAPDGTNLVAASDGMSFAHLKELIVGIYGFGYSAKDVIERLKKMEIKPVKSPLVTETEEKRISLDGPAIAVTPL